MKDKLLNILGRLSQYVEKDKDLFYDGEEIWEELSGQGFTEEDIEGAVGMIEKSVLKFPGKFWSDSIPVSRSFTAEEMTRLSPRVRGYLWSLKSSGIIDHSLEDEIIQRALNLDDPAGLREIKTVAALTIFGYEHRSFVFEESVQSSHMN